MNSKNKNKKIKYGALAFLAVTTTVVVPPLLVSQFKKIKINNSKFFEFIKENVNTVDDLENFINSDNLKDQLLQNGVIDESTANSISKINLTLSNNNSQIAGSYVNVDIEIIYNEKNSNKVENITNIPTSILIINFNESLFRTKISKIDINELSNLLNPSNIIQTIVDLNVGFPQNSLSSANVKKSSNNYSNFYTNSRECTYKLDFNFEITNQYVFNYNLSNFGSPDFRNSKDVFNVDTIGINVEFNTSNLEQSILDMNSFDSINDLLTNSDSLNNLVNNSNVVDENDWIAGNNITASVSEDGYLQIDITTELINGQTNSTGPIKTGLKVVNFNETNFRDYMKDVINKSSLDSSNLDATLLLTNSNLSSENLQSGTSIATQLSNPVDNGTGNMVYPYDFDIKLNDSYCLFDPNLGSITNNIILNNVITGIASSVVINNNKLESSISTSITNPDSLNNILTNNGQLLDLVKDSECVSNPEYIQSVSASDITVSGDDFVRVEIEITLNSEQTPNPVRIPVNTGMKIVTINRPNLDAYFSNNVTSNSQVSADGILNSLNLSNSNLNLENLASATATISSPAYELNPNKDNLPCSVFDLVVNLNNGFVFYNFENKQISTSTNIDDVLTAIVDANINLNESNLQQSIQDLNTVTEVNNAINNDIDFVKESGLVDPKDLVQSATLTPSVDESGKIKLTASVEFKNGQSAQIEASTNVNVVNFNRESFINSIKDITNVSSLEPDNLINTLANTNSNLTVDNLNSANTTASQSASAIADPDRNNNEYYQYSFNINLNENYCLFENGQLLSAIPNLDDLWTSILVKANVNIDTFKQNVIEFANSISNINQLLGESSQKGLEIAQSSNIVSDSNLITSVDFANITTSDDSVIKLKATIHYSTNQEPTVVEIDTNMKIVKLNQEALISYFNTSVNSQEMINNSISTLVSSSSGLTNEALANSTSITPSTNVYENDVNIPYNAYDININLNTDYCFYDANSQQMTSSQTISNVMSKIPYTITPNATSIEEYIRANYNSFSTSQTLLNMSSEELVNLFNQHSYVQDSVWIESIELTTSNNGNQIQYNFVVNYHNGESSNLEILTDIQILVFDEVTFANYIKTIDNASLLTTPDLINTIVNSAAGISEAGMLNDSSTNSEQLPTPGTVNDISGLECYNYNFNIVLSDQYCFYNDSQMSNSVNPSNILSNVYVPTVISNDAINNIKTAFENITIDNYKDYFENANNKPEKNNSGYMTSSMLSSLSGDLIDVNAILSISINKSGNTDNGYLLLDINIELNKPYEFNGNNNISLSSVVTGMYDPNSSFNLSLFYYNTTSNSNDTLVGFDWTTIQNNNIEKLYLPYQIVWSNGQYIASNSINTGLRLIGRFSQYQTTRTYSNFRNGNFTIIDFTGTETFTGATQSNYLRNNGRLSYAYFGDCINFTSIGIGMFQDCGSLVYVDASGATLTYVDNSAFSGCNNLRTIIVKDEASKNLIQTALNAIGLSNVEVTIKS